MNIIALRYEAPETGRAKARKLYPVLRVCEKCGKPAEIRHHKDTNTHNNEVSNVQFLCVHCHVKTHNVYRGLAKKGSNKTRQILEKQKQRALDIKERGLENVSEYYIGI